MIDNNCLFKIQAIVSRHKGLNIKLKPNSVRKVYLIVHYRKNQISNNINLNIIILCQTSLKSNH